MTTPSSYSVELSGLSVPACEMAKGLSGQSAGLCSVLNFMWFLSVCSSSLSRGSPALEHWIYLWDKQCSYFLLVYAITYF